MKKEIEQFKKDNGTITYTTKELIGALHVKTDCIINKLDKKADKTMVWRITGALFALILFALGLIKFF